MHGASMANDKIYDRMAADLPRNSVVAPAVVKDEAGDYIKVLRSVRNDPLVGMLSRKQIDEAQFVAGRTWQAHHEHSQIGSISAIDPTKEAVDGGKIPEPISDRQIKAIRALQAAERQLGAFGASLIFDVLGRRMSISEIARARMMTRQREIDFLSMRFRECLESLAKHWGLA